MVVITLKVCALIQARQTYATGGGGVEDSGPGREAVNAGRKRGQTDIQGLDMQTDRLND
jgi:hypothetical protein